MITKLKNNSLDEEELIKENMPFVYQFVNKIIEKYPYFKDYREDLISAGIEGLLIAARKYDEEKQVKFLTYATYQIKDKIYKEIKGLNAAGFKTAALTSSREKKIFKLLKKQKNIKEIAKILGLKEKTINKYISSKISVYESLDEDIKLKTGETVSKHEIIPSSFSMQEIERNLDNEKLRKILNDAINESLNKKESYIIYHRIVAEKQKTLQELGDELKVSRERIRQIEKKALGKLKKYLQRKNVSLKNFIL